MVILRKSHPPAVETIVTVSHPVGLGRSFTGAMGDPFRHYPQLGWGRTALSGPPLREVLPGKANKVLAFRADASYPTGVSIQKFPTGDLWSTSPHVDVAFAIAIGNRK